MTVDLRTAVDSLNKASVQAVADFLRSEGIKGTLGKRCKCPVARYLGRETGMLVGADRWGIFAYDEQQPMTRPDEIVTPISVADFIAHFDAGNFPDLVDTMEQV